MPAMDQDGPSQTPADARADTDGPGDQARGDRVSTELKQAFQALIGDGIPAEDRPRWQQRLLAITNSAKHDLATAEERLDRWWQEFEAAGGQRPEDPRG